MSLSDKNERDDDDVDPYRLKVHHCFEKKENVLVNARPGVSYLSKMLSVELFPELWHVRGEL